MDGKATVEDSTAAELEALRQRVKELEREEERFRTFFDDAPVGKSMTGPDGKLMRINRAFGELLGYSLEEMQRINFAEITHPDDVAESKECVRCLLAGEQDTWVMDKRYLARDGRHVWTHVTTRLHRDADGKPQHFLTHIQDISDRKDLEQALQERVKELTCLQSIGKIVEESGADIEGLLARAVQVLPGSWLHTHCAVACISLDDQSHETGDMTRCVARQRAEIKVAGEVRGAVEVGYTAEQPPRDEGPFLAEERTLIDAVAERLGRVIERVENDRKLRETQDRLRLLFDAMPIGWAEHEIVLDEHGAAVDYVFLDANPAFEGLTGLQPEAILGRRVTEVSPGIRDQQPDLIRRYGEVTRTGDQQSFELQLEPGDRWLYVSAFRSAVGHFVTMLEDITRRKRSEQRAAAEQLKARTFLDNTADLVTVVDAAGKFTYVNRAAGAIYEREPEELIGTLAFDTIHPDDRETTQQAFAGWLEARVDHASWENRQVSQSGAVRHMLWTIMPRWVDGELDSIWSIARDITEIKEAERSLRESEARFRTIAETSPDMIYRMSLPDGKYEYVSPAAVRLFGYTPEEFVTNPLLIQQAIHPDWHGYFAEEWDKLLADKAPPIYEYQIVRKDGEVRWLNQRNVVLHDEDGRPAAIWGIVTDVTESKEAHEALAASREELRQHQEHLEQLVQQRTAELDAEVEERRQAQAALARKTEVTNAINKVFRDALSCESEEQVAQTALQVAEELTGARFGFIGQINAEGRFDTIGLSNPGWKACEMPDSTAALLIRNMEIRGIWGAVIREGRAQIVNDPAAHPDRVGIPKGHPPLTSFLGVPFKRADRTVGMIALGNKDGGFDEADREAIEALAGAVHEVLARKRMELQQQQQSLLESGQTALAQRMLGDLSAEGLCQNIITQLCSWLELPTGLLYLADEQGTLRLAASHAHVPGEQPVVFRPGEGLVGQAALDRKELVLTDVPESYFAIQSGLGRTVPRTIHVKPVVLNDRVRAVLELGSLAPLAAHQAAFLDSVTESIGYAVESATARETQARLLEEAQRLTEELQAQQEELQSANEELESQTQRLAASEEELKSQREELQVSNEELEEKNELLDRQKQQVEQARGELADRAEELALASKYKSEFLANMSHELRTPLNSLLLLARSLWDNKEGNLTADQVESASVIYHSGNDLLSLINEILDLSRIEAGRMDLHLDRVEVAELAGALRKAFQHVAEDKGLTFTVAAEPGAATSLTTDGKRVEQVLRNLVANAIKFTEQGSVRVSIGPAAPDTELQSPDLDPAQVLAITVADTGIGISPEHQQQIFEAFQQADGSTARRYSGTGLGLSISRELVALLGGEIQLASEEGRGSSFTVFLPLEPPETRSVPRPAPAPAPRPERRPPAERRTRQPAPAIRDDRQQVGRDDRTILLVEDDPRFAEILARQCRERGLRVLAAATGEEGVELARRFNPRGVLLDLKLPGMDGWQVLELLKGNPATRHIPVHIMSVDEPSTRALSKGAVGYAQKPVSPEQVGAALEKLEQTASRQVKRVLVVEDDEQVRRGIVELITDTDVAVDEAAGGAQAIAALRGQSYDCMILDLSLWDFDGDELLRRIEREPDIDLPPVIVHTARDLSWEQDLDLRAYSDSIIIKGVRSDERLLDEVSLFLHRVVAEMPEPKRKVITSLHDVNAPLRDKKVLIVDDDMRTLFALTRILADRGMQVLKAENGEKALAVLEQHPDVDVVLMDIMMPVLDGYATMKRIRGTEKIKQLPIIALTAKAMKGDQERCLAAGASDYLPKPVDQERLVSMLRVWLYR